MRRKKHKQTRRATNYYRINYGFHEPYKVLLDGNFIHAMRAINLPNVEAHVGKLLGGTCKFYTTKCVTKELKGLGHDFAASAAAARGFALHKCGHGEEGGGGAVSAAECIAEQIGTRNEGHWFVATQDSALRQSLARVPGCPLVFATVNGVHLETPSEVSKEKAKQSEAAQQSLPRHEVAAEPLLAQLEELRPRIHTSARFRKNRAKGPNPLAVKKKVKKPAAAGAAGPKTAGPKAAGREAAGGASGAAGGSGGDAAAAHKRKRKRGPGAGGAAAGAADE